MVICLGRGADLLKVQLMPLSLTVSCFSKIKIGTGSPEWSIKQVLQCHIMMCSVMLPAAFTQHLFCTCYFLLSKIIYLSFLHSKMLNLA